MFKRIAVIVAFLAFAGASMAEAALSDNPQRPDIVGWGADRGTAPIVGVDHDGDILPARNDRQDLGESTRSWRKVFTGAIESPNGFINTHETFVGISSPNVQALSDNGFAISTISVGVPTTLQYTSITQSSTVPRNLIVYSSATDIVTQIVVGTMTLSGSATFYGVNAKGEQISELIYFSTRNVALLSTMSVTHSGPVFNSTGVGNQAFAFITSFTVSLSSISDSMMGAVPGFTLNVGYGNKFGLANSVETSSDVYKATVDGRNITQFVAPAIVVDTVYDTIVVPFGTATGGGGAPTGTQRLDVWSRNKKSPQ